MKNGMNTILIVLGVLVVGYFAVLLLTAWL